MSKNLNDRKLSSFFYTHDAGSNSAGANAILAANMAGGSKKSIKTGALSDYGSYLESVQEDLNSLLDKLNVAMSNITNDWADADGHKLVSGFSTFINDAKNISKQINELGTYAKGMATNYSDLIKDCLEIMKK